MKKIYLLMLCALLFSTAKTNAQCASGLYNTYYFSGSTVSTVTYSTVYSQQMDIYQPTGDTSSSRPVIILAHEGSFTSGDRTSDATVDSLCARFARRGYVTVSIDYRLAASSLAMTNLTTATDEVAKAISDGKAAIRYMSQNASIYKIDTNRLFIGGNSAGAVLYMHVGYIDSVAECSPLIDTALVHNGGFDGNSGNPGYTTKAKAVINFAGALNTVNLVGVNDIASVNAQGDQDLVVPYTCNKALYGVCPDTLCGLGSLESQYVAKGINHVSKIYVGQGHVPWDADATMFNTVDSMANVFLYSMVCNNITAVNVINTSSEVKLFPNPATSVLNMNSTQAIKDVIIYDQMGRVVMNTEHINQLSYEFNTSRLPAGIYLVKIMFNDENNAPVVKRISIQ
jgi:para-nitrobenzyl esterase